MELGKYECKTWTTFIQQALNYANNGYYYYNYYALADERLKSVDAIDEKIIKSYDANMSKDRRYYHKKSGKANHAYLRFKGMIIVLKTDGEDAPEDKKPHKTTVYKDFRVTPLVLKPDPDGELEIKIDRPFPNKDIFTMFITRRSYDLIKEKLNRLIVKRNITGIYKVFGALNGIPAHKSIVKQKKALKTHIVKMSRRHGVPLNIEKLQMTTKLIRHKVYK